MAAPQDMNDWFVLVGGSGRLWGKVGPSADVALGSGIGGGDPIWVGTFGLAAMPAMPGPKAPVDFFTGADLPAEVHGAATFTWTQPW